MSTEIIHDRGRGPEIVGTRITVYDLLPYFLEPDTTEALICRIYDFLTPLRVAAARAYVLKHFDEVVAEHRRIEARNAAGNPPEVVERLERTHARFESLRQSYRQRHAEQAQKVSTESVPPGPEKGAIVPAPFPAFREWLAQQDLSGMEPS